MKKKKKGKEKEKMRKASISQAGRAVGQVYPQARADVSMSFKLSSLYNSAAGFLGTDWSKGVGHFPSDSSSEISGTGESQIVFAFLEGVSTL